MGRPKLHSGAGYDDRKWTTEKIEEVRRAMKRDGAVLKYSPFYGGNLMLRKASISFTYTEEEHDEIIRCMSGEEGEGIKYFAEKYCYIRTKDGRTPITLRSYQHDVLDTYIRENRIVMVSGRQSGKTIVTAIFIAWHLCFETDFEIMIAADDKNTARDILKKVYEIMEHLPFFMQPGIKEKNKTQASYDNDNVIRAEATDENSGIGFTGNLLYVDEFGRIEERMATEFWKAIMPTLSSMPDAKAIVTSTAAGPNHFYSLLNGARNREAKNNFFAIEIDWRIVPRYNDRGERITPEEFREQMIMELGKGNLAEGERLFNQEYANEFFIDGKMLLSGDDLKYLKDSERDFRFIEISALLDKEVDYSGLLWHPDVTDDVVFAEHDRFVISIDLGGGLGQDYSVMNIFKLIPLTELAISRKANVEDIYDFFALRQIGVFRSNILSVPEVAKVADALIFDVLGGDNCRMVLEMNYKGDLFLEKLSNNPEYYDNLVMHSFHRINSAIQEAGLVIQKENKEVFCREFKKKINERRIVVDEKETVNELKGFGQNKQGSYSCDVGHDDIAMTCINLVPFFDSEYMEDLVEDVLMGLDKELVEKMVKRVDEIEEAEAAKIERLTAGDAQNEEPNIYQWLNQPEPGVGFRGFKENPFANDKF